MINDLAKGITIDDISYAPVSVEIININRSNAWLKFVLTEGKNREIRRIIDVFGLKISKLIRVAYGMFNLDNYKLKVGQVLPIQKPVCTKI